MNIKKNLLSAQAFYKKNDLESAKKVCMSLLKSNKGDLRVIDLLIDISIKSENFGEALKFLDQAIDIDHKNYLFYFKKSFTLFRLNKHEQALNNLDKSINLKFDFKEAYNLKAIIFSNINRDNHAIKNWLKAISINKNYTEAYFNLANFYNSKNNFELSLKNYNKTLEINNNYFLALANRADLYLKFQLYKSALTDYNTLIEKYPKLPKLHYSKASTLDFMGKKKEAIFSLNICINLEPKFAMAYFLKGIISWTLKLHKEALVNLEKGYSLNKDSYFLNPLIVLKSTLCDWKNIQYYQNELISSINKNQKTKFPIFIQHFIDSPELEQKASILYNKNFKFLKKPILKNKNKKIRLGYYSADFREHATSHLIARVFELHNKKNFEIIAFSFCPLNNNDVAQKRIVNSCDKFIDVHNKTDKEISLISKGLKIDIALDLMGLANNNRYNIFSLGCAPIQVNYLGYPGTCGSDFIDYIIADKTLITNENKKFFSEKIIFLPKTYQPNDNKKEISKKEISKKEFGLPEDKFIFCVFNRSYKITSKMLSIWAHILNSKKNSIIWLFADNDLTKINLKKEFNALGINAGRIIFANPTNHSNHLARHKFANLFIDTFPYTGHTTVSDALWTGLPVVTKMGNSFASRVSASLLNALNVSELVTKTDEEYKKMIIELSNDHNKLLKIREKISKNIFKEALFDSNLYTKNLEKTYQIIYENYFANKKIDIQI